MQRIVVQLASGEEYLLPSWATWNDHLLYERRVGTKVVGLINDFLPKPVPMRMV